jgi:hypothetical protein
MEGVGSNMVSIGDIASSGTIDLSTGDVTGSSPAPQTFTSFTSDDDASTSQTSNELTIMPKASSTITISISANTVSRDGLSAIPTANKTATLITALNAGANYTITVRLRVPIFARSNIYWDNQKLTFVPADGTTDNQGYQGVFFRWGSLVGVSPALTEEPESEGTMTDDFLPSTPIYVPVFNTTTPTSSTWKATIGNAMKDDAAFPNVKSNWTDWATTSADNAASAANIPYMDGSYAKSDEMVYGRDKTYVIDAALNRDTTYQGFRGDICQYLGKTQTALEGYRLPTSYEFGVSNGAYRWTSGTTSSDGWQKNTDPLPANNAAGKADGRANLLVATENNGGTIYGSCINTTMGNAVFPSSGYRVVNGGSLYAVGLSGYYWSGSAGNNATRGYYLYFDSAEVAPHYSIYRSYAFPVRCVKN